VGVRSIRGRRQWVSIYRRTAYRTTR